MKGWLAALKGSFRSLGLQAGTNRCAHPPVSLENITRCLELWLSASQKTEIPSSRYLEPGLALRAVLSPVQQKGTGRTRNDVWLGWQHHKLLCKAATNQPPSPSVGYHAFIQSKILSLLWS